jgi:putative surface layer protein sapB11
MAVTQAQVAQLYVALFNRAPEGDGFRAWVAAGAPKTQAQIANEMLASPATAPYYASLGIDISTNRGYVELIYKNILGKDYVRDPDGINAWVRHLDAGHSRGDTLVKLFEVATSAEARAADPVAAAVFANKTEIASYMAQKIADIRQDLSGDYDYREFQEIIKTTTATNLDEQKARIDALAASTVHNLSTDSNEVLGSVGQDIFNAVADSVVSNATLKPTDKIDGGGGENTLNVRVNDSFNGMTTGYIKHIDNLNLTSTAPTAKTFNARGIEGLKKVTLDSQKGLNLLNPQNIVDISLQNVTSNAADGFKLDYNSSTIAGVDDTQNLTLDKVNLHKYAITGVTGSDNAGINIPNIENLNISTKGEKSNVTIKSGADTGNHYKNITVKGNTDLTVKAESDRIEKFDASAFTATLDYTYKALATTPSGATSIIKGGSSKDVINLDFKDVSAANARPYFEIDGGAGNDEVIVKHLKANENRFNIKNVEKVGIEKVDTGVANSTATADFTGSDVTHLYTSKFKDNLKVVNSSIKSVTVDKPALDESGNPVISSGPYGTTQFTNGYLENINVENTIDPRNPVGEAIINPTVPGLRSKVTAYVSADESEKVTVNIGKNVYAQKIAGDWVNSDRMHANEGIGIIAPRAKDITVNFNSPGTLGNSHANTTGISITNVALADLSTTAGANQRDLSGAFDKLTINSKSNILSNVDATFLEKLKVFNINTDTNFEAIGDRKFEAIQQINASGLASNNIKTGKVFFTDNVIGKGNGATGTADATQSIGIKAEHLNSFKANKGIFTKGNINVNLNDMQGQAEIANGINTTSTDTMQAHFDNWSNVTHNFQYGASTTEASVVTEGTFRVNANNITNLLVGNIIARDIEISAGNARGNVSLASSGGQYTTVSSPHANGVGKIGNDKTINNTIDLSQVAGSYNVGELFGQNIKFKAAVFNSPTYYSEEIDTGLKSDKNNYNSYATTNTIKANFGGTRANQDIISLEAKGVQSNSDGNTNVYVKFDDNTASPNDLKTFKATGENVNLIVNGKFNTGTTSKLETIDLSDVKTGSTSFLNLSAVAFSTDETSHSGTTAPGYSSWHNSTANQGFGNAGNSNLKNPLSDNYGTAYANNFKATSTLPDFGARTGVTGNDVPTFSGTKLSHTNVDGTSTSLTRPSTELVRQKSDLGANQHTKLSYIKGTQGNDVVLLANDMATGVAANSDGIKRLNVDLGDGDDVIHVGTLADKTEIVIDGGRGADLFDVSRAKTNAAVNKIVTIKNIEAGDKIKLADYFAHGYDPKDPTGDNHDAGYTSSTLHTTRATDTKIKFYDTGHPTNLSNEGQPSVNGRYFHTTKVVNKAAEEVHRVTPAYDKPVDITGSTVNGQRDTAPNKSTVDGYDYSTNTKPTIQPGIERGIVAQTGTDGHAGGDRYEYTATYGDLAWQTGAATHNKTIIAGASQNISVGGKGANGQYTSETFLNGATKPFIEKGAAPVAADLSTTKSTGVTVPTTGWIPGTPSTPAPDPLTYPGATSWTTWVATKADGTTVTYHAANTVHAAAPTQGTGNWRLNTDGKFYETGTAQNQHTIVNGVLYSNEYNDIHGAAGAVGIKPGTPIANPHGSGAIIQNSGIQGQVGPAATAPTATNLRKAVVIETSTTSDKHNTTIGNSDKAFYDAHNIIKLTINSKYTDLTTVAGMDTLVQAVNHTISINKMWSDTTTVSNSYGDGATKFEATYYSDQNGATTSGEVLSGWVRKINHVGIDGSYEAHNDRLYAFSWRGDTYLVYDKKATATGVANSIGQEDTIVRLAGVNLDSLKYTVDPEKGTITINDVQFGG